MKPCLDAVGAQIGNLLRGLESDGQTNWDIRYDFLAFHNSEDGLHWYHSVFMPPVPLIMGIYQNMQDARFFTRNLSEFKQALAELPVEGEEMQLLALDIAADFPWRPSSDCHRVVVLLSDETVETGVRVDEQIRQEDALINKLQDKHIKLFIVAPESASFYRVSAADRCEYMALDATRDGLRSVDFSKMLQAIGKSVSVSQSYGGACSDPRPLFDQLEWVGTDRGSFGEDRT